MNRSEQTNSRSEEKQLNKEKNMPKTLNSARDSGKNTNLVTRDDSTKKRSELLSGSNCNMNARLVIDHDKARVTESVLKAEAHLDYSKSLIGGYKSTLLKLAEQLDNLPPSIEDAAQEVRELRNAYEEVSAQLDNLSIEYHELFSHARNLREEVDFIQSEALNLLNELREKEDTLQSYKMRNALNEYQSRHRKRERDQYRERIKNAKWFLFKPFLLKSIKIERNQKIKIIEQSGLFDSTWYRTQCEDTVREPVHHYVWAGALEGLNPHPIFDTNWYLLQSTEARRCGENPLVHYLTVGWKQGKNPHPWFNVQWYIDTYAEKKETIIEPLRHYLEVGEQKGFNPHPKFDSNWYKQTYLPGANGEENALMHFVKKGQYQGNMPNSQFLAPDSVVNDAFTLKSIKERMKQRQKVINGSNISIKASLNAKTVVSLRGGNDGYIEHATPEPSKLDLEYANGAMKNVVSIKHKELITVIIPLYNNAGYIARAINSALSQQGVNCELIVIDDGSTDESVAVARKVSEGRDNVKIVSLLRNFGCYYARNVGLLEANGAYITTLDSDDIMAPDRLLRQMDAFKNNPHAWAVRCHQRRWSADFTRPMGGPGPGENSLLWKRELVDSIGWYDSVRFSGDAEFRLRIQRVFGTEAVLVMPDELYYTRVRENSLTTAADSRVFMQQNNKLEVKLSESRKNYLDKFTAWQKSAKPREAGGQHGMYIGFPLATRPFDLGADGQNASRSLGVKRIGTMASYPARRHSLPVALQSILPQIDHLILYLNNYEDVPEGAEHEKIEIIRSQDAVGDLRDNGKFYSIPNDVNAYVFTLDDDLVYPKDYVARMVHYIEALGRSSVVGVHGVVFPEQEFNDLKQRTVFDFRYKASGHFVDLLGTGTTAWHTSALKLSLEDFGTTGVCDLWFAAAAAKSNVPLFSIPRRKAWLTEVKRHEERLYKEALENPEGYFGIYNRVLGPALRGGVVRRQMEQHLATGYSADAMASADISFQRPAPHSQVVPTQRRPVIIEAGPSVKDEKSAHGTDQIHFHVVINGWNCREYIDDCLRSVAGQVPSEYTYEVTIVDDGSSDGTYERLAGATILPNAELIRIAANSGPAYARHLGIKRVRDPETIVVLVDLDDWLEPNALRTVAEAYRNDQKCLMTIGNWRDQNGILNPQEFYTKEQIDDQRVREVELFNATHLRTFRRKLYDAVSEDDLCDENGEWLQACTDVALMYPLLDQCWAEEVQFISDPIYRYRRKHNRGTLARFGKPYKIDRLNYLKRQKPKNKLRRHA